MDECVPPLKRRHVCRHGKSSDLADERLPAFPLSSPELLSTRPRLSSPIADLVPQLNPRRPNQFHDAPIMQAFWSRAAQTRSSCRCSACLHVASAIARRTTTAASKRRLNVGDLFTACYSTIFGTAVFADAKAKQQRRKEWDLAIAEAKAGISMDEPERVERTVPDAGHPQNLPSIVRSVLGERRLRAADWNGTSLTTSRTIHHDPVDITLDLHLKQSLAIPTVTHQLSPSPEVEGYWPDGAYTNFSPREPLARLHVDKMEEMISKLVTRLLLRSRDLSNLVDFSIAKTDISFQVKEIAKRLESLQGSDTRLPSYTFYDLRAAALERWRLNSAIQTLLENTATDHSNVGLILAKICYNLLVSSTPPNIQTYNILIHYLTRLRLYELAQVVVDSFLYESKFKPSSTTIQLILNHYSVQKDTAGFRAIVNRMRAADGDMRMRKRSLDSLCKPQIQEWAMTTKVLQKGGYLREKIPRDSNIFDSLINGFLELDLLKSAVRYLRAALREGMQVSSKTLLRVVEECTRVLDYEAGLLVLRALLRQWEEDSSSTILYSSQARLAVHRLFGLCGIKPSLDSRRLLPRNVSRIAVVNLQRHMTIQSIEDKIDRFAERIMSVETALVGSQAKNGFRPTSVEYITKALSILRAGFHIDRTRHLKKEANNEEAATLRDAKPTEHKPWLAAQYEKLPTKWMKKYDLMIGRNPDLCWSDRLKIISHYQRGNDLTCEQLSKLGLRRRQPGQTDAVTTEQTLTVETKPRNREKLKAPLLSPSKRSTESSSPQRSHWSPSIPRPPPPLALSLPVAPIHANPRLQATAG